MFLFDPATFQIIDVNEAVIKNYGYTREELHKLSVLEIRPKEDEKEAKKIIKGLVKHKEIYTGYSRHIKKNGEIIHVNIHSSVVNIKGKEIRLAIALDITEQLKAEEALKLSERRFKGLIQDGSDLIAVVDINGNYTYINPSTDNPFGVDPANLIGLNAFEFIHEFDKARLLTQFTLLSSQRRVKIDPFRFLAADGSYIWIETTATNLLDDPSVNGIVINSRDVSERYAFEEKLRKQEALFRAIIEKGTEMKVLIKPDGTITFGTPSIKQNLGYDPEDYLGKNESDIVHPDDVEPLFEKINYSITNHKSINSFEIRVKNKAGEYRWCEKTITNLLNDQDVNALVCNFRDITDKKHSDQKIKEANERYNLVSLATSDAIWDYDFRNRRTYIAGTGYYQLFGYKVINEFSDKKTWQSFIHPEDREEVLKNLKQFIHNSNNSQYVYEYRFLRANGSYAHVRDKLFILRENGEPIRLIGAMSDITHEKNEAQNLKLLESVITNANDAVMITDVPTTDKDGPKIIYVNEAFSRMSGFSKEEILGNTPVMFNGPGTGDTELLLLEHAFNKKESCEVEIINYKKTGEQYWVGIAIAPVTDTKGQVINFIAIERDITSRKVQEQEREKLIFELLQNNKDLRQFSYVTSHNLRGPIANLLGLSSLIDNYKIKDPTLKQILDGIKKATLRFDETIRDLTDVLQVKDRPSIPREDLEIQAVYEKVIAQCEQAISESKAQIAIDFSAASSINFNKAYMESIFLNLVTNAIKYRSPYRPLVLSISTESHEHEVILKFKDNGLGIDLKLHKDKLFRLYQRFHDHTEGKGLGLFLIKSQIEALGGSIEIESVVGEGTLFILKFKKN